MKKNKYKLLSSLYFSGLAVVLILFIAFLNIETELKHGLIILATLLLMAALRESSSPVQSQAEILENFNLKLLRILEEVQQTQPSDTRKKN